MYILGFFYLNELRLLKKRRKKYELAFKVLTMLIYFDIFFLIYFLRKRNYIFKKTADWIFHHFGEN